MYEAFFFLVYVSPSLHRLRMDSQTQAVSCRKDLFLDCDKQTKAPNLTLNKFTLSVYILLPVKYAHRFYSVAIRKNYKHKLSQTNDTTIQSQLKNV